MKKFTKSAIFSSAFIALSFAFSPLKAQYQLPNSNFETFETGFNSVGQQPTGWKGSNVSQSAPVVGTITKALVRSESAGHTGNCVNIHNELVGVPGIAEAPAPAFIALGTPWNAISGTDANSAIGGCTDGLNFTYRPDTLSLWVKHTPSNSENATVAIYMWTGNSQGSAYRNKGNTCTSSSRTNEEVDIRGTNNCTSQGGATLIGNGQWKSNTTISSWQQIKVPVTYSSNNAPAKINVIISAAAYPYSGSENANSVKAGSQLWADDLSLIYSSKIYDLRVNNRTINGFNANTLTYTVTLGNGVTTIPPITAYRSGRQLGVGNSAEISITNGAVDGAPTTITVTAEDGSSTTTYTLNFVSQLSNNPRPTMIKIDGANVPNFNAYVTSYNISLPYGTATCPTVSVVKAEEEQTVSVSNCAGVPGSQTVTVTAADGTTTATYTLNYTVAPLTDNTLQMIYTGGNPIQNFNPNTNNYTVELPLGTAVAPEITWQSAYPTGAQTILLNPAGLSGTSTITVQAGGSAVRTYRITFVITMSSNAYLSGITVGGELLEGFNSQTFNYNHVLPRGTTVLPAIAYTKGEPNQTVSVTQNGVNGETRITVTAQNGTTILIYRINFSVERSENSLLNNIFVGGEAISDFRSDSLTYDIELPSGTTEMPEITWTEGDYAQNIRLLTNGGLNGVSTIRVAAENPAFVTTYTLNFSVVRSANAQLLAILIDGDTIDGFSPDIFSYSYALPETATECPLITVIKAVEGQFVTITAPEISGRATIEVTSETNDGSNIYTIDFGIISSNNFLDSIYIDGIKLAEFTPENLNYTINLPTGSIAPTINYFVSDSTARTVLVNGGLNGTQILVTASNGATRTYSISYNIAPSINATLADIQLWNGTNFVSLADFAPTQYEYTVPLAWRTKDIPAIQPIFGSENQQVTVYYDVINDTTKITVFAENPAYSSEYKLFFPVEKSDVKTLSSILVNGNEIDNTFADANFHPQLYDYVIKLPYGTTETPTITYEKGKNSSQQTVYEQNVEITSGSLQEPAIVKVFAENGETQIYTLNFVIDMSSKFGQNYLDNILIGGVPVTAFDSATFNYSVVLPYGTTEMPTVEYLKKYPEQSVFVATSGINGVVSIKVLSNIPTVAATEYTIKLSVSDIPTTTLSSISFNGVALANFDPRVKTYIVPVTAQSTVAYDFDENEFYVDVDDTYSLTHHKKLVLTVSAQNNPDDFNTYTFWYYYTNDVIPNASFEDWSNTVSGRRPDNWNAPNTVRSNLGSSTTSSTGDLISQLGSHTSGSSSAYLNGGLYCSSSTQDFPSLITLGNFWNNETKFLGISGTWILGSSSGVNGGINFRNTPDEVKMDYIYDRRTSNSSTCKGEAEMRVVFQLWNTGNDYPGTGSITNTVYTDRTSRSSWYTMTKAVIYSGENSYPQRMNIIINANRSENTADLYPTACDRSKLTADNLRFGYNSTLTNVFVNGAAVSGFNGAVNNSNSEFWVAEETMALPVITFANAVPDQEVRVTISDEYTNPDETSIHRRNVDIYSKAEDNTTLTHYIVVVKRPSATSSALADIKINGVSLAGFAPNTFTYNVSVPNETLYSPDLSIIKGEGHQTVSYAVSNGKVIITVNAENGAQSTYTLNFIKQKSDNSKLLNIEVEGHTINFEPETFEYSVTLPANSTQIPNISFTKTSNGQTVILTSCQVNDTAVIRVAAEDSLHFSDYKIIFALENVVTSHLLSEIYINGSPLSGFASNTFEYGVNNLQSILFEKEFLQDTIIAEYFADSIKCYIGENIYKITVENEPSHNSHLQNIFAATLIYGENTFIYSIVNDEENLPDVTISTYFGQTVSVAWAENSVKFTVTAQDTYTQSEYIINFVSSVISNYSYLKDILLDGVSLDDFQPNVFTYNIELVEGAVQIPVITAIKGEIHQTIAYDNGGTNGATTITVTAQDGTQSVYTLIFSVKLSENALLNAIYLNGELIENFDSQTFNYSHVLPYGTTELPLVTYDKGHPNQDVTDTPNGVNGIYTIAVVSEDGLHSNNYTITFSVEPSPNALLASITANGTEISGFYPEIFEYQHIVIYGTTTVPTIIGVPSDEYQTVEYQYAATLGDTTYITVTAQNGINQNIYKVWFEIRKSNNAFLADIIIGGESLSVPANGYITDTYFLPEQLDYNITLPYGTTIVPAIDWVGQVSDYYEINYSSANGVNVTATIEVISQDETAVNVYTLNFTVAKSDNSIPLDILLKGNSIINEFDSETFEYNIQYPVHSDASVYATADDVACIIGEQHQTYTIIENGTTIIITVTAENGSQKNYIITQEILKCNNALLSDILINGISIENFDPNVFEYSYLLPFGSTEIPAFEGVKSTEHPEQQIDNTPSFVNEKSFIYVEAEDGTIVEYSIFFAVSDDNPGNEPKPDDVCFNYYSEGVFKASTKRNNVSIVIYDITGRIIFKVAVPLSDPNDDICDADSNGVFFNVPKRGYVYIYSFIYNNKKQIKGSSISDKRKKGTDKFLY
jgi:hypothetical protein